MLPDVLQRAADYVSGFLSSPLAHNVPLIMGLAVAVPIALALILAIVRNRLLG